VSLGLLNDAATGRAATSADTTAAALEAAEPRKAPRGREDASPKESGNVLQDQSCLRPVNIDAEIRMNYCNPYQIDIDARVLSTCSLSKAWRMTGTLIESGRSPDVRPVSASHTRSTETMMIQDEKSSEKK